MKKRIGIVTGQYKCINYGGSLQAYALCRVISKLNIASVEQIQNLQVTSTISGEQKTKKARLKPLKRVARIKDSIVFRMRKKVWNQVLISREKAFRHFNEDLTPHSSRLYTLQNISECVDNYDVFITGSDQVWNPYWYNPNFLLKFVPSDKIKSSYAASLGTSWLTDEQRERFRADLSDYTAISVREDSAVDLLKDVAPVNVKWVLDPTLLLDRSDWDEIADKDELSDQKYLFCYFLSGNKTERKLAKQFGKKHGLKIISIPFSSLDFNFGDVRYYDASPEQFINLIKNAEVVFTDSFHATIFSHIYEKEYFVFNRSDDNKMISRLKTLVNLFKTEERICDTADRQKLEYIEFCKAIDYTEKRTDIEQMKIESIDFLKNLVESVE